MHQTGWGTAGFGAVLACGYGLRSAYGMAHAHVDWAKPAHGCVGAGTRQVRWQ